MIDFELLITVFLIFLNILIVSYSFKKKDNNNLESNNCDKIVEKCTNLPIYFVKIAVFFLIIFFLSFITFILKSFQIQFLEDIIDFSLDFGSWHLLIYFIDYFIKEKYNFIKCSIYYIIRILIKTCFIFIANYLNI